MSGIVNIGEANAGDQFYRYKMPKLISKVEGRGNGIKTCIPNMVDIAKALARPASYTTKYFGCELGAQTTFNEDSGRAIVNGAHTAQVLSSLLEGFINRFVQCGSCKNPETVMSVKKGMIRMDCKACGARTDVDMRHKLCTFILKNPPAKPEKKDKKDKKDKDKKLKKSKSKKSKDGDNDGDDEELVAKAKEADEFRSGIGMYDENADANDYAPEPVGGDDDEEEVVWATDTSAAAQAARAADQLTDAAAELVSEDKEAKAKAAEEEKAKAKAEKKAAKAAAKAAAAAAAEEEEGEDDDEEPQIVVEARAFAEDHSASEFASHMEALKLPSEQEKLGVAFLALFGADPAAIKKELPRKKKYLKKLCAKSPESQKLLLGCIEHFCCEVEPELIPAIAVILKFCYDEDIVEEEVIIEWHAAGYKANRALGIAKEDGKAIRKAADALVEWLQEAEEDSD